MLVMAELCSRVSVNPIKTIKSYLTKSSATLVPGKSCPRDSYRQIKNIHKQAVKKLLCFIGGALLLLNVQAQEIEPFFIGDRIPDLTLHRIINYKDTLATLSSFGDKLIILDFWGIHCSSCIEQFPKEDSLQNIFKDKLQFILVCTDPREKVIVFLKQYNKTHQTSLSMPIIYGDSILYYLFPHHFIPHYTWIAPDGELTAQTDKDFINASIISVITTAVKKKQYEMRQSGFPDNMLHFPQTAQLLKEAIEDNHPLR